MSTGWIPKPGTPTCWHSEDGTCPEWMHNPATRACRGTINLAVPFSLGSDGTGADAYQGRYGIPAEAIRHPQGALVRHCGPWDHTSAPQKRALQHEYWLRTGRPFVGQPSTQEVLDVKYTRGGGLYELLPQVVGRVEVTPGVILVDLVSGRGLDGASLQVSYLLGLEWQVGPVGRPIPIPAGSHTVFLQALSPSGVGASWSATVTVPAEDGGDLPPPPPPPGLSPIEQRVEELNIYLDRIASRGPAWLRRMIAEARKVEGDLVRKALAVALRLKRKMLSEEQSQ